MQNHERAKGTTRRERIINEASTLQIIGLLAIMPAVNYISSKFNSIKKKQELKKHFADLKNKYEINASGYSTDVEVMFTDDELNEWRAQ